MVLARVAPLGPRAIHVAVVDPGVGTDRRPVAVFAARGDIFIGPDNGLLIKAVEMLGGTTECWVLEPERLRSRAGLSARDLSQTFHGRDVFAPAAALLSTGVPIQDIARKCGSTSLVRVDEPVCRLIPGGLAAEVVEIDRFGNVGLSMRFDDCPMASSAVTVKFDDEDLSDWDAVVVQTFGQLRPGELGVYRDSWGQVALALNGASAAELLGVTRGLTLRVVARAAE
jgi:S-adenosylmethionine hydrolase